MTKVVGTAGRFRCQYGRKIRAEVTAVEKIEKQKFICPACGFKRVKRVESAIWHCSKCDHKFAGAMYQPQRVKPETEETKKTEKPEEKKNV